jgi:REP element-mobilizing transposase RayT
MRKLRVNYAGAIQHVGNRGSNGQVMFVDSEDKRVFLRILGNVLTKHNATALAYCLMTNHYHLLLHTPEPVLDRIMQELGSQYTRAFNRRHGREGALCRGRYWSKPVRSEKYLAHAASYVDANPVRHGVVHDAAEWLWSSFRANTGMALKPRWLDTDRLLVHVGGTAGRYADLVRHLAHQALDSSPEGAFALHQLE